MDVGTIINHYHVVEHIGRGGMADVWSARDSRLNRMVAIKTIQAGLTGDADPVELFEKEAKTIAALEHPHILPIYDFGEIEGQLYIVMRYVTGGSLEDVLERGPLPFAEVLRVGQAVSSALDYAHMNKVVHLDLKPPNILLDSQSAPYLADFGLAAVVGPEGRVANPGSGTLLYMAPEQMTEDVIDYRADIYSFAVMIFHMLAGALPFDATQPLALKQLQYQDEIPDIDVINPRVPPVVSKILKRGTAVDPQQRYASLTDLYEELREALSSDGALQVQESWEQYSVSGIDAGDIMTEPLIETDDMALLEAVDLYSRARHAWARGTGRFLLGVTHYMLMSGYYAQAARYGLEIDESGYQMLLRGALEYDHDIDIWWQKLDNDNRRWVCLHAVRSENAPARIRALYRLETLPDSDVQQIPRIVAQTLQVETYDDAKMAALRVLGTRSKLMAVRPEYQVQTQFRARLISSLTRISVQQRAPSLWREAVYTPEIDRLVAETALNQKSPQVADLAARTAGQMRSLAAVRYLAQQQKAGVKGALRALALVRDEAPSLPPEVDWRGRFYAWIANTWRRIIDQPMNLVWRFVFALLGSWLGIGANVFLTYRSSAVLHPMRMGSSVGFGLTFGVIAALLVVLAGEVPWRLRGFWPWWSRFLLSTVAGFAVGVFAWSAYSYLFLYAVPDVDLMIFGGVALAFGLIVTGQFNLRGWAALGITWLVLYLSMYFPFHNFCTQVYLCMDAPPFSETPVALVGLLIGALTVWAGRRQNSQEPRDLTISARWPEWLKITGSAGLGLVWAGAIWLLYALSLGDPQWTQHSALIFITLLTAAALFWLVNSETRRGGKIVTAAIFALLWLGVTYQLYSQSAGGAWTHIAALALSSALVGMGVTALFSRPAALAFFGTALAAFISLGLFLNPYFAGANLTTLQPTALALLYYDFDYQIFTLGLPVALMIALGAHARTVLDTVLDFVGPSPLETDRPAALTGFLIFMLAASSLATFQALFSLNSLLATGLSLLVNTIGLAFSAPLLALGALLMGLLTVTLALFMLIWAAGTLLATIGIWRWKRWGAYGLIASLAFFAVNRVAQAVLLLNTLVPNEDGQLVQPALALSEVLLIVNAWVVLVIAVLLLRDQVGQMAMTLGTPQRKIAPVPAAAPAAAVQAAPVARATLETQPDASEGDGRGAAPALTEDEDTPTERDWER
ncbi:MAG: serine/threonine protein kinase [Chloroflexi bacterium]|nr:serine/threonine protein kinase [Chloroflexota bacterium]